MNQHEHIESSEIIPCPIPTDKKFRNLSGHRFGRLLVLEFYGQRKRASYYTCRCDCGVVKTVSAADMKIGKIISCGCYSREISRKIGKNNVTHGKSKTITYNSWSSMRDRCLNPNDSHFIDYGGRGLKICARWLASFENFYDDMGERPAGLTIERRDNELGYSPENCYWGTPKQQGRNKRNNRMITYNGMTRCVTAWDEHLGFPLNTVWQRLVAGWSVEKAITTPSKRGSNMPPNP